VLAYSGLVPDADEESTLTDSLQGAYIMDRTQRQGLYLDEDEAIGCTFGTLEDLPLDLVSGSRSAGAEIRAGARDYCSSPIAALYCSVYCIVAFTV
jgi:hypothetical protein